MAEVTPSKEDLLVSAIKFYREKFNDQLPTVAACAPGRVNIIGEHTDYNNGFVLPMALSRVTVLIGAPNDSEDIVVHTACSEVGQWTSAYFKTPYFELLVPGEPQWANYVKGIVKFFHGKVPGFNAVVVSSVPMGAGLSSSAALEVATYTFLEALTGNKTQDLKEKALACQKAEHEFAGVPCGIMDQFISIMGEKNKAMLLDCKNLNVNMVQFSDPSVVILITNSNVKHALTGSEYTTRRKQCYDAAAILGVDSLREVSSNKLQNYCDKMDLATLKRARHVVGEISRTSEGFIALRMGDFPSLGLLMLQSHNSLRDDYEVSCLELDQLVDIAMNCPGVLGSRMTGAGFGGCTVTLVKREYVECLLSRLKEHYYSGKATFYLASPSEGATDLTEELNQILSRVSSILPSTATLDIPCP